MRNISTKADNVGDALPASDFNANLKSELQNVVTSAGFTLDPEGGPDTDVEMFGKSIIQNVNAGQYYQDSGSANTYVLARVGTLKQLTSYIDGATVVFKAGNANTGASTINVDSLGAKALRDNTDTALVGGEIIADGYVVARYNSSNDRFEILFSNSIKDLPVPASGDELQNIQVNSDGDGYELCGPLTSFKNKIINGNFDLWDYATSQTSDGIDSDNHWDNGHNGSTKTHSRQSFTLGQTDVPNNPTYFSRTVVVTGSGAGHYVFKSQRIEHVETFSGQDIVVSFWAKADSSKDIASEFIQYFGSGGSPSASVNGIGVTTHSITTAWAKYYATVTLPSVSGKTLGTNENDSLRLYFWFDAGSDLDSRTNSLGNQSGTFDIAQVQIESGVVPTYFEQRPLSEEQRLCDWFAQVGHQVTSIGVNHNGALTTSVIGRYILRNPMRKEPSVTCSSFSISNLFVRRLGSSTDYALTSITNVTLIKNILLTLQFATATNFSTEGVYVNGSATLTITAEI